MTRLPACFVLLAALLLSGCSSDLLHPSGDVAARQLDLLIDSTLLMLLIIIPVMVLTALFAWRYRLSNKTATYAPDWHHSTQLELVIWGGPLLIVVFLGALTWLGTHLLDPYRPLDRLAEDTPLQAGEPPLEVDVVALDWKWLFIYPQYGVASLNTLAAPAGRPLDFHITSSSVMNSFYIPALAGQIYAMPGMQTRLHAVINRAGDYQGISANYSGAGFSHMHFTFHAMDEAGFGAWVAKVKAAGDVLDTHTYQALEVPSENVRPHLYGGIEARLFQRVLEMCVEPGTMCSSEMAAIDARGGLGLAGITNTLPLAYDKFARRGAAFGERQGPVASICTPQDAKPASVTVQAAAPPRRMTPLYGLGLARPASFSLSN